jgi:RNA polymerase sigma-70 factor (ECF subfamily)
MQSEIDNRTLYSVASALTGERGVASALRAADDVEALFAANIDFIYAVCLRHMGDPERARELAQETLLVAWRRLPGFEGRSTFRTWLYAIARNLCWRALRKKRDALVDDHVLDAVGAQSASVVRLLRREERGELVRAAVATLDPAEQQALWLRYGEDLPVPVVTELLDVPGKSGARALLQRSRRKLALAIERCLDERAVGTSFLRSSL